MIIGRHSYVAGEFHEGEIPVTIGNFTQIGEDFFVHGPDNMASVFHHDLVSNYRFTSWYPDWPLSAISKGLVVIGNDVWIGRDVKVLSGVVIGNGAIVAAHSVVTKNVPSYSMVGGNPAIIKKMRFDDGVIQKLMKIRWWDWDDQTIKDRLPQMKNINEFIEKYS